MENGEDMTGFVPSWKGELCTVRLWCLSVLWDGILWADICSIAQLWVEYSCCSWGGNSWLPWDCIIYNKNEFKYSEFQLAENNCEVTRCIMTYCFCECTIQNKQVWCDLGALYMVGDCHGNSETCDKSLTNTCTFLTLMVLKVRWEIAQHTVKLY